LIKGSVTHYDRERIGTLLSEHFSVDHVPVSKGSTLNTDLLRSIHKKIFPTGDSSKRVELLFSELLVHFGEASEDLDFSAGSTITQHGYRKLLRAATGAEFCFVLNYADHEVSAEYADVLEESYGFSKTVTGKVPFMDSDAGSKVIFYATRKCKTEPSKTFFASARVSSIVEVAEGEFRANLEGFERFSSPVSREFVEIAGRNEQHGIVEISQSTFDQIYAAGKSEAMAIEQDELDILEHETLMHRNELLPMIEGLTDHSPQIILTGPPGTGKTHLAQKLANYVISDGRRVEGTNRVRVVQFHPSYGYEDFVEGLKPASNPAGGIDFKVVPGIILQLAAEIEKDGLPRVLIIDEINRANLPRVFGELMYLLEYRDQEISLTQTKSFKLPQKLKIIGTLNTADRSVQSIDLALRRRFDFFEVAPNVEVLKKFFSLKGNINQLGESLFSGFELLNSHLEREIGDRHLLVGHSYFMRPEMTHETLSRIWNQQLYPLIEDYFFDQPKLAEEFSYEKYWG
jgi:hypothetical protein